MVYAEGGSLRNLWGTCGCPGEGLSSSFLESPRKISGGITLSLPYDLLSSVSVNIA